MKCQAYHNHKTSYYEYLPHHHLTFRIPFSFPEKDYDKMPIQRKGMRALQIWVSRVTAAYPNVEIVDLTTSFRNGLAFCAIIHHFRPDLMPTMDALRAEDVLENNALAFKVAEEELDIPALLDAQDMVECEEPDKFSVVTYVSQFYHLFKDADDSRASPKPAPKLTLLGRRASSESENDSLIQSSAENTPLGTPTTTPRGVKAFASAAARPAVAKPLFNQAELIAKYGEEIFSVSSPKSVVSSTPAKSAVPAIRNAKPTVGVSSVCNDLAAKMRIFEEKAS